MNPFLITGMGRSGTKWLARELNKINGIEVRHEDPEDTLLKFKTPRGTQNLDVLYKRFRDGYGEVNSLLREVATNLAYEGVDIYLLVRDPRDIVRSVNDARGRDLLGVEQTIDECLEGIRTVEILGRGPVPVFRFEDMINKGIRDIQVRLGLGIRTWEESLNTELVNASEHPRRTPPWHEWPYRVKDSFCAGPYAKHMKRFGYEW